MPELTIEQIMELLPHRYPILLVDRVAAMDTEERRIVGIKNVSINEPFFQGHFPGHPVMPGVLQLEAMAQTGSILLVTLLQTIEVIPYFLSIDKAKFRRVVTPGDQLHIEVHITTLKPRLARMRGVVKVGDEVASEADLLCMISPKQAAD